MSSLYTDRIRALAPDEDHAHIEAWMRLEHPVLDGLSAEHFAREVQFAIKCVDATGLDESDALARSYGLEPAARVARNDVEYGVDDEVLVARDPGLDPAPAKIVAASHDRPHIVKVIYLHSRTGAWIARSRIVGPASGPG